MWQELGRAKCALKDKVAGVGGRRVQLEELVEGFPPNNKNPSLLPTQPLHRSGSPWSVRTAVLWGGDPIRSNATQPSLHHRTATSDIKLPGQPTLQGISSSPPWRVEGDWSLRPSSWETKYGSPGVQGSRRRRGPWGSPTVICCSLGSEPHFSRRLLTSLN